MKTTRDEGFTAYVAARRTDLLRLAAMLTAGDAALAEDLVQTTLIKVYLGWNRIRPELGPHPYARRVLVTSFVDEHRRPWRRREQSEPVLPDTAALAQRDPGDPLGQLRPALLALPPRMRAAVILRHLDELTVAETAAALGCSEGTVKSQTARGLDHLRRTISLDTNLTARSTS